MYLEILKNLNFDLVGRSKFQNLNDLFLLGEGCGRLFHSNCRESAPAEGLNAALETVVTS